MVEVVLHIQNHRVVNFQEFQTKFNQLKDGRHLVTITDLRHRSVPQNAYYWAVIVPLVRKGLRDNGYDEVKTTTDAHEVMKHLFLRKRIVSKSNGEVIDIAGSSAKLNVLEFNEYIESICKWSSEFLGVVIPSPHEELTTFISTINHSE